MPRVRAVLITISFMMGAWCSAAAAAELKIGYVKLDKVFDGYERTKESDRLLEQKSQKKHTELETRATELKKLRENLELLSDQARDTKAREAEEKSDEFQRLKTRSQRDLVRERNAMAKTILDEIQEAITDYAKANGFSVMLDRRSLVYGQDAYDVTDEVLKVLNERYATKKAATKP